MTEQPAPSPRPYLFVAVRAVAFSVAYLAMPWLVSGADRDAVSPWRLLLGRMFEDETVPWVALALAGLAAGAAAYEWERRRRPS